jgi:hypothetical protein
VTKLVLENLTTLEGLPNGHVKLEARENNLGGRVLFEHTFKPHEFEAIRALFGEPIAQSLAAVEPIAEYVGGPINVEGEVAEVEPTIAEAVGIAVGSGNRPKTEGAGKAVKTRIAAASGSAGGKGGTG